MLAGSEKVSHPETQEGRRWHSWPENKSEGWGDQRPCSKAGKQGKPSPWVTSGLPFTLGRTICFACAFIQMLLSQNRFHRRPQNWVWSRRRMNLPEASLFFSFLVLGSVPGHDPNITFRGCSFLCDCFLTGQGTQSLSYPH